MGSRIEQSETWSALEPGPSIRLTGSMGGGDLPAWTPVEIRFKGRPSQGPRRETEERQVSLVVVNMQTQRLSSCSHRKHFIEDKRETIHSKYYGATTLCVRALTSLLLTFLHVCTLNQSKVSLA